MIEQLVAKTFASRNAAHLQHWRTKSFAGHKALAGTLDSIRLTTVNGTDTFDAGAVNILYEG